MESVDSTSSVIPLTVSFHFDKWRISLKKRPCGWSGLASISPLGLETRNVEPSRILMLLSFMRRLSLCATGDRVSAPLAPLGFLACCFRIARRWQSVAWTPPDERRLARFGRLARFVGKPSLPAVSAVYLGAQSLRAWLRAPSA